MNVKNLTDRILQLPEILKKSAREFSISIGKSEGFMGALKNRGSIPSVDVIYTILSTYTNVSPMWLLFGKGDVFANFDLENGQSEHNDYKKLYEDERAENLRLRGEAVNWRNALMDTMKKNEQLITENARLTIENNNLKTK